MAKTTTPTQAQTYLAVVAIRKMRNGEPINKDSRTPHTFGPWLPLIESMNDTLHTATNGLESDVAAMKTMEAFWLALREQPEYASLVAAVDQKDLEELGRNGQRDDSKEPVRPSAAGDTNDMSAQTTPQPVVVTMSDVHAEAVEWLWWPYLAIGKLTMLDGDPGTGKSLLMTQVAASLSRGDPLPDQQGKPTLATGGPHTTLLLSSEDGLADTLRPRLDQAGADTSKIHVLTGWTGGDQQTLQMFTLQHMNILEEAVARVKPSLVIIDPIQAYLGKIDMHRANETRPLLAALTRLAERYRFALVCIRHPSKPGQSGGKAIHRGLGSVDFIGAARTGLFVEQHPTDPGKVLLGQSKSNIGRLGRTQVFTKHEGIFEWCGVSRLTAELIFGSGRGPDPHSFLEAVCWLEDELKPGIPQASKALEEQAEEEGIARITLKRAKKALDVRSYKKDDAWICQLPDLLIIDPPIPNIPEPLESLESLEPLEPLDTLQLNQWVKMRDGDEGQRTGQEYQVDQVAQVAQVDQEAQVVTGVSPPSRAGEGRTRAANGYLTRREMFARNTKLWDRPRVPERCPACGHRDWDMTRRGEAICIPCAERGESA